MSCSEKLRITCASFSQFSLELLNDIQLYPVKSFFNAQLWGLFIVNTSYYPNVLLLFILSFFCWFALLLRYVQLRVLYSYIFVPKTLLLINYLLFYFLTDWSVVRHIEIRNLPYKHLFIIIIIIIINYYYYYYYYYLHLLFSTCISESVFCDKKPINNHCICCWWKVFSW